VDLSAHLIADLDVSPPDTMGQTFDVLAHADVIPEHLAQQLEKAVGFRNIALHHLRSGKQVEVVRGPLLGVHGILPAKKNVTGW
jgi:uncharacterized protein YutE (UPF0331/DUF86 family)